MFYRLIRARHALPPIHLRSALPPRDAASAAPTASAPSRWRPCSADRAFGAAPSRRPHRTSARSPPGRRTSRPKAKSVIFLFMDGGPSQVDTFDPKPRLDQRARPADQDEDRADAVQQRRQRARHARGSSSQYGQSGIPVSDLFPHVADVRRRPGRHPLDGRRTSPSTPTPTTSCTPATGMQGRPSMGAWVTYGLGSECQRPARLRRPQRRPDPARRARLLQQRLPAGRVPGLALPARRARRSPTSRRQRADAELQREQARPAAQARPGRARAAAAHDDALEVGDRQLRAGLPHAGGRARADRPRRRDGGDAAALRPGRAYDQTRDLRPRSA